MMKYFKKFIPHLSELLEPLTSLTMTFRKKSAQICWNLEAENAFERLREVLENAIDKNISQQNLKRYILMRRMWRWELHFCNLYVEKNGNLTLENAIRLNVKESQNVQIRHR
eukprot:GHVP01064438.1.p1 GENE.GHVP01064438.1~~GHVP01064438.1.p1  ORF type:complete len:112 (+),score=8.08 GHVP01064438.1:443-778(+)